MVESRIRILILNRSYWPDAEATGQLLTELCEDLASSFDVTVICGQPNENPTNAAFRRFGTELHNNVTIRRVWHTRFPKAFLPGRAVNYLSFIAAAFWAAVWSRRPHLVVAETDPPLLALVARFLQRWRGTKLLVYLQDIHPDIGIALGKLRDNWMTRLIRRRLLQAYTGADRVITLSRDMRDHLVAAGVPAAKVQVIPNWVDTESIYPVKQGNVFRDRHGINGQRVVMYSGNLGLCQRLEDVISAADLLRERTDILFVLVGDGARKAELEQHVVARRIPNVRFLDYQPKHELAQSLGAADLHLIPLDARVASCLMPSKLYGILASGTPVLAIAPHDCELATITHEHGVGRVVAPGAPALLAKAIIDLADDPDLPAMGARARDLACRSYDRVHVTAQFRRTVMSVLDDSAC
jgi:glycosyltransferase involved in cell wall biosynthesis